MPAPGSIPTGRSLLVRVAVQRDLMDAGPAGRFHHLDVLLAEPVEIRQDASGSAPATHLGCWQPYENLVISLLRLDGTTNIAGALRYNAGNNRRVLKHLDL